MRLAGVDREKDGFLHARRKTGIVGERRGFGEKVVNQSFKAKIQ